MSLLRGSINGKSGKGETVAANSKKRRTGPKKNASDGGAPKAPASRSAGSTPRPLGRHREREADPALRSLVELGLTLAEARAYVSLLTAQQLTAGEIAGRAGIQRPKVYEALRLLEERGFCTAFISGSSTVFRANTPSLALEQWVRQRDEDRLLAAEHDRALAAQLVADLPKPVAAEANGGASDFLEAVNGRVNTSEALTRIVDDAQRSVMNMTQPPWLQPRTQWNIAELRALERGVRVRTLYTRSALTEPDRWLPLVEAGGEARVTDAIPLKLILSDSGEAMLSPLNPTTGEQGLSNVIVRHPDLVTTLELLFEREWDRAEPLQAPAEAGEDKRRGRRAAKADSSA
jgi:HTH-type transcriptional regulator, sugar sensing transcriptional regulator